ncbi:MAG: recombination protein O N-terminal domain-containing protein [Treponema sp.]|nr:recombination protein O N-terminal domain-containing protein [Treponema sp.]
MTAFQNTSSTNTTKENTVQTHTTDRVNKLNRNYQTEAVVLSISSLGENNSLVTLLTKDRGIVKACLYGGPKSKLKSLCAQWNAGNIWIYETPEKNQNKISDFEVKKYHGTFGENLFKSYAALLAAELVIKTECAGGGDNIPNCWTLLNGFFDGLELSNEEQGKTGLIRFLWRFIHLSGLMPDTEECEICGRPLFSRSETKEDLLKEKIRLLEEMFGTPSENNEPASPSAQAFYSYNNSSFICEECARGIQGQKLQVSPIGINYLSSIINLPASASRNMPLDEESYLQIKQIVFDMAEKAANGSLNTLKSGIGIL